MSGLAFLELTESNRTELQREVMIMVDKSDRSTTNVDVVNGVVQGNLVVARQVVDIATAHGSLQPLEPAGFLPFTDVE